VHDAAVLSGSFLRNFLRNFGELSGISVVRSGRTRPRFAADSVLLRSHEYETATGGPAGHCGQFQHAVAN
jgi:hypothetical protein